MVSYNIHIMKQKSVLYKNEQLAILEKIINILQLDDNKSIILYNLDHDVNKKKQIMEMLPEIRKYFSFSYIHGARNPEKIKRPYISIVRQIAKLKYDMKHIDWRIKVDGKEVRTQKYELNRYINRMKNEQRLMEQFNDKIRKPIDIIYVNDNITFIIKNLK
jgi:hypothetical protein